MKKIRGIMVLDASGSMTGIRQSTHSAINEFIESQKSDEDTTLEFAVMAFDSGMDGNVRLKMIRELGDVRTMRAVEFDEYRPAGNTPLYDAIMRGIAKLNEPAEAADAYMVVIVTDGGENASKEFKRTDVVQKIQALEGTGKWTFSYIGANQDAWTVAQSIGMSNQGGAMSYTADAGSVNVVNTVLRASTSDYRRGVSSGIGGQSLNLVASAANFSLVCTRCGQTADSHPADHTFVA